MLAKVMMQPYRAPKHAKWAFTAQLLGFTRKLSQNIKEEAQNWGIEPSSTPISTLRAQEIKSVQLINFPCALTWLFSPLGQFLQSGCAVVPYQAKTVMEANFFRSRFFSPSFPTQKASGDHQAGQQNLSTSEPYLPLRDETYDAPLRNSACWPHTNSYSFWTEWGFVNLLPPEEFCF